MNLELLLLKLFLNNTDIYVKYSRYTKTKYNNIYTKLYNALSILKEDDKASHAPVDLALAFHGAYPVLPSAEAEVAERIFSDLDSIKIEPDQAEHILTKLKERYIASEIALEAVRVASGEGEFSDLEEHIKQIQEEESSLDEEQNYFVSDDISEIQAKLEAEPPFKFRLKTLNRILGGLRRRTFGFIFARPEVGKTQLLASEASFLAPQTNRGILWINNEEDGSALIIRCYQSALLQDSQTLFSNTKLAKEQYNEKLQGKLRIYDRPGASYQELERIIKEFQPDIIFIDQLDKVRGFKAERYDLEQKAKYQWAREIAKRYNCAVVGICQAGGSAEGKRFLDMNDVDSSHTAKQGEADWMFGLGVSDKIGEEDRRFISIAKNKLFPTPDMIPEMRHAKVPITSKPEIQIYEDALNV